MIAPTAGRWIDNQISERIRLHGRTFVTDAGLIVVSYLLAELVRFDGPIPAESFRGLLAAIPLIVLISAVANYSFALHRRLWNYAGMADFSAILQSSIISMLVIIAFDLVLPGTRLLPLTVIPAGALFAVAALTGVRVWRRLLPARGVEREGVWRVLIVGAGQGGQLVAADLLNSGDGGQCPVGFVDDNLQKRKMRIHGLPVLGTVDDLPRVVQEHRVDLIGVAIPSASSREIDRILALAQQTDARIQVLPSRAEAWLTNTPLRLRDVNLDDLLDRSAHVDAAQNPLVAATLGGRTVLVTGARGSIGAEICKQVLRMNPKRVIALDNNETGLFYLLRELSRDPNRDLLVPVLADIRDAAQLDQIFRTYQPAVIFHAAAYKHVPMLEAHPEAAVSVNVQGTWNLCRLAREYGCERFVNISTDKAVNPVNALGFSKRIGELLVQAHSGYDTIFCSVRFGNVIGSRGSALPEFIHQIDAGGPVTVTDPEVDRYFMTIPEAVSLVIQAGALARGKELFMLDMGQPVKLVDLVKRIIRLRGLRVGKDIEIIYTGLRPGEKLTEKLVFDDETVTPTENPAVFVVQDDVHPELMHLEHRLLLLDEVAKGGDRDAIRATLLGVALFEGMQAMEPLRSVS